MLVKDRTQETVHFLSDYEIMFILTLGVAEVFHKVLLFLYLNGS